MIDIFNYDYIDLQEMVISQGWKAFRGRQIFKWLYRNKVTSFDEMSDLNLETRDFLKSHFLLSLPELVDRQEAKDGTVKYLFKLQDGIFVESVLMNFEYGKSVCVSSQVGCNMGCTFCASGQLKKQRDLETAEMVAQIMYIQQDLDIYKERVSHIVVMGIGEPFDNYDNVMKFLSIMNDDNGLAIGARHITISTCGIVPKIKRFAKAQYQYNLAISLHAPNDALRTTLMPINQAYPLQELMDALRRYEILNNRRLTFEYILLKDVNDQKEHAFQLAKLLKGHHYYINLIPYNKIEEGKFIGVDRVHAMRFYDELMKLGVRCTIRKEHGSDIDAACGQLRAKKMKKGSYDE
ncbi:MAG: 23S rRNA (adenine(2503)-C(2))-methyltransferase RlmN [Breznakia sp.]